MLSLPHTFRLKHAEGSAVYFYSRAAPAEAFLKGSFSNTGYSCYIPIRNQWE
jgi:hypothetical protein